MKRKLNLFTHMFLLKHSDIHIIHISTHMLHTTVHTLKHSVIIKLKAGVTNTSAGQKRVT